MRFGFSWMFALGALASSAALAQSDSASQRILELAPLSEPAARAPEPPADSLLHDDSIEDLSLEDDEDEPAAPAHQGPRCPTLSPRSAPIGVSPEAREALGLCGARAALFPFVSSGAMTLTRELWCSDPQGAKASARARAIALLAQERPSPAQEASLAKRGSPSRPSGSAAPSFFRWDFPLADRSRSESATAAPAREPSRPAALEWDAREAQICASWREGPPELMASVSARSVGRATLGGRDCPALLAEAKAVSGRFAGASAAIIVGLGECAGLSSPMRHPFSSAFVSEAAAAAWNEELIRSAQWRGPSPPAARGPALGNP